MRAFWSAVAGWALGQVAPLLFYLGAGEAASAQELLPMSINFGAFCACMCGCIAAGMVGVPAGGCAVYVVGWSLLLTAAYLIFTWLGLPSVLVVVLALTGLLVGFCVPGEGAISVLMLFLLLLITSAYGVATLLLPPVAGQTRLVTTLVGLNAFAIAQIVLARRLKKK